MANFEEKTIRTESIFQGRIINLQVDEVLLPNGKTSKRELVKHPGAVAVIAVTEQNKIIFVEQFRKPLEKNLVEIPAGKLEEGEAPELTARRELEEETGFTTEKLDLVTSFYTSPGFADELLYIYYTDELIPLDEPKELDEDEFVEILELTLEEAEQYMEQKKIHDAKTAFAIAYLKLKGMK